MHGTHYPATTAMDVQGLRRALAPRSVYLGSPSYQPSQQADLYTGGIDGDGVFGVYDTVRMLLSAQIVSDTHHASHMFQHTPRVAA
jgi:hypothetical protein